MIFFISIIPMTAIIGSLLVYATLVCKFGRRKIALMTDYLSIIGVLITLLGIWLINVPIFYIGRGICGLGVGLNASLVPIYIKEISPDAIT